MARYTLDTVADFFLSSENVLDEIIAEGSDDDLEFSEDEELDDESNNKNRCKNANKHNFLL